MNMDTENEADWRGSFFGNKVGICCSRAFPLVTVLGCLLVLLVVPFRIISRGYLPSDDALRHAALAVADKTLDQVMVSDGPIIDVHYGWHSFLRGVHALGVETTDDLVVFEVVFLFLFFVIPPLFLFKRSETWIFVLLLSYSLLGFGTRLFIGRPLVSVMAVVLQILLTRQRLNAKKTPWGLLSWLGFVMTLSIWWRSTWFLYLFPIVTFAAARQWRAFGRLMALLLGATILGAIFCGDFGFFISGLTVVFNALGSADNVRSLVGELQPMTSFFYVTVATTLILICTHLRGGDVRARLDSPVFFILAGSCFLASQANRWFAEFGTVAFLVLLGEELDAWITEKKLSWFNWSSFSRVAVVGAAVALLFVGYTADQGGRWTAALKREYVDIADPKLQIGLPGDDGIIYNSSMGIFFETFFKYPHAPWRYMLGCEAAMMPEEDLKIFRKIQWNNGAVETYQPWVDKMRPQDRMWLTLNIGAKPQIKELEWTQMTSYIWSGRKGGADD
jgi:hypothetical protein